jgi:indole-3-glycerol phosphate synthase
MSPQRGYKEYDPVEIAIDYESHGAAAISFGEDHFLNAEHLQRSPKCFPSVVAKDLFIQ